MPAGDFGELVHHFLHNGGSGGVVWVDRFTRLEVDIGILRGAAQDGMLRGECSCSMGTDQVIVQKEAQFFIRKLEDLGYFVRGPESVKEMNEGDARFERGSLRDGGEIVRFLHRTRGEQGPARLADSHHILMIAENGKAMCGNGARRNMEDRAGEFARDLVHVGDHQQQTLRGGEGGGERAGLQCAMHCARRAAFGLHFDHERDGAPEILLAFG